MIELEIEYEEWFNRRDEIEYVEWFGRFTVNGHAMTQSNYTAPLHGHYLWSKFSWFESFCGEMVNTAVSAAKFLLVRSVKSIFCLSQIFKFF